MPSCRHILSGVELVSYKASQNKVPAWSYKVMVIPVDTSCPVQNLLVIKPRSCRQTHLVRCRTWQSQCQVSVCRHILSGVELLDLKAKFLSVDTSFPVQNLLVTKASSCMQTHLVHCRTCQSQSQVPVCRHILSGVELVSLKAKFLSVDTSFLVQNVLVTKPGSCLQTHHVRCRTCQSQSQVPVCRHILCGVELVGLKAKFLTLDTYFPVQNLLVTKPSSSLQTHLVWCRNLFVDAERFCPTAFTF